jgi:hypothetical protein
MDELGYFYFKDRTGDTFRYAVTYLSATYFISVSGSMMHLEGCAGEQ